MMLPDAYIIILMKSIVSGPSKMADNFDPHVLILNDLIWLTETNAVATLAEPQAF